MSSGLALLFEEKVLPSLPEKSSAASSSPSGKGGKFVCEPCQKSFGSIATLRTHLESKQCQKKQREQLSASSKTAAAASDLDKAFAKAQKLEASAPKKAAVLFFDCGTNFFEAGAFLPAAQSLLRVLQLVSIDRGLGERYHCYRTYLLLGEIASSVSKFAAARAFHLALDCFVLSGALTTLSITKPLVSSYTAALRSHLFAEPTLVDFLVSDTPKINPASLVEQALLRAARCLRRAEYLEYAAGLAVDEQAKANLLNLAANSYLKWSKPSSLLSRAVATTAAIECWMASRNWTLALDLIIKANDRWQCERLLSALEGVEDVDSELIRRCTAFLDYL